MPLIRKILAGLVGAALVMTVTACRLASLDEAAPGSGNQALAIASATPTSQPPATVVWGRVPYCNCFAGSATANVAKSLKEASLTVSLKEQSPRDGWLYFVVAFDPDFVTTDQVNAAMLAGGAEVIDGPP